MKDCRYSHHEVYDDGHARQSPPGGAPRLGRGKRAALTSRAWIELNEAASTPMPQEREIFENAIHYRITLGLPMDARVSTRSFKEKWAGLDESTSSVASKPAERIGSAAARPPG